MRVLGFDPSLTNFGWALYDSEASNFCLEHGRFQTSSKTLFIDRYIDLRSKVVSLIRRLQVTRLGIEYPVFNDIYSEGMYGLFLYTCEALRKSKVDVVFFSPGQIKAHARALIVPIKNLKTGDYVDMPFRPKGWKMEKPDMVEAAKLDSNSKKSWNHNEADAYWVARTAYRFWSYYDKSLENKDLTSVEKKQFSEVHTFVRGKRKGQTVHKGILYRENERFFLWSKE